jgi:hypothetical protein
MTPEMEKALDHVDAQFRALSEHVEQELKRLQHNTLIIAIHGPEAYIKAIIEKEQP